MKNNRGFTFIEMLFSLVILFVVVSLFSPILHVLNQQPKVRLNHFEWEVFYQQTKMEIKEAKEMTVTNNILYMKNPSGQLVSYEPYQDKIRRRVNGTGHEILLQKIDAVLYKPIYQGVEITVKDISGREYRRRVTSYAELNVY